MKTLLWDRVGLIFGFLLIHGFPLQAAASIQIDRRVVPVDIWFGEGKSLLKQGPHNAPVLKKLSEQLQRVDLIHLEIEGNPDADASPKFNETLSRERADALRAALVELYRLPFGRIQIHPAGETHAADHKTAAPPGSNPMFVILYSLAPGK